MVSYLSILTIGEISVKLIIKITAIIFISLFLPGALFSLEKKGGIKEELLPGKQVEASVDLTVKSYKTFKFKVSPETYTATLTISGAPADLDLFVKYGKKIDTYDNVDYVKATDSYNEKLLITRMSDPSLSEGYYYVDVAYQRDVLPAVKGHRINVIPFTILLKETKATVTSTLLPGEAYTASLYPETGMAATFSFNVPEQTQVFRVDISRTNSDLDLMCAYENNVITKKNYDYISETLLGKESLVVRNNDGSPLKAGTYYITAFDQASGDYPEPFSITASMNTLPPPDLLKIPGLIPPGNEQENALFSTVEIIGGAGKGSGCLVSPSGYIITNYHVIRDNRNTLSKNIYVAVNRSLRNPPDELFRARVVDYREKSDLALLKIDSGLYGQPLPRGELFPYFSLGTSTNLKIGQPLSIVGYPGVGGTGSRASVSLTTGIVSGFEDTGLTSFIKTDAEINSGNSGGAVIDVYYNLVGFPTVTIGEDSGQIGYITPVSAIPSEWFRYFR